MDYKQTLIVAGCTAAIGFLGVLSANLGSFDMPQIYAGLASGVISAVIDAVQQYIAQKKAVVSVGVSEENIETPSKILIGQSK